MPNEPSPGLYRNIAHVNAASSVATTVKAVSVTCTASLRPLSIRSHPANPDIITRTALSWSNSPA